MLASITGSAAEASPDLVHYLPIGSTLVSAAFIIVLLARAKKRKWAPHLVWWAIGVFFYGVGTALESSVTLVGNSAIQFQLWYWAGAILGAYPLATGSVYLLMPRKVAHWMTAITLVIVIALGVAIFMSPIRADIITQDAYRPNGEALEWQWIRAFTPIINIYALIFLVGGAFRSSVRFFMSGDQPKRAIGTALIAVGALLPGIGGTAAKFDMVELLYIGELIGIILIWIGYEFCIRAPAPKAAQEKAGDQAPASAQPA